MVVGSRRGSAQIGARIDGVDVAAHGAHLHPLGGDRHRLGERGEEIVLLLDQMQRGAARRARSEARQAREKLDQALDLGAGGGTGHGFLSG